MTDEPEPLYVQIARLSGKYSEIRFSGNPPRWRGRGFEAGSGFAPLPQVGEWHETFGAVELLVDLARRGASIQILAARQVDKLGRVHGDEFVVRVRSRDGDPGPRRRSCTRQVVVDGRAATLVLAIARAWHGHAAHLGQVGRRRRAA